MSQGSPNSEERGKEKDRKEKQGLLLQFKTHSNILSRRVMGSEHIRFLCLLWVAITTPECYASGQLVKHLYVRLNRKHIVQFKYECK